MKTKRPKRRQQVATSAVVCDGPECRECGGLGGVTRRVDAPHVGRYHVVCPHCNGTGRARVM